MFLNRLNNIIWIGITKVCMRLHCLIYFFLLSSSSYLVYAVPSVVLLCWSLRLNSCLFVFLQEKIYFHCTAKFLLMTILGLKRKSQRNMGTDVGLWFLFIFIFILLWCIHVWFVSFHFVPFHHLSSTILVLFVMWMMRWLPKCLIWGLQKPRNYQEFNQVKKNYYFVNCYIWMKEPIDRLIRSFFSIQSQGDVNTSIRVACVKSSNSAQEMNSKIINFNIFNCLENNRVKLILFSSSSSLVIGH